MKIRNKISFSFVPVFIITLLIIGGSVYFYFSGQIKRQVEAYLFSSARAKAEHIRTFLQDEISVAKIMSASTVYRDLLKESVDSPQYLDLKARVEKRLQRTLESEDNLINLHILDKNGQIIASSDLAEEGKDKSQESYFLEGKAGVYIKDIHFSADSKEAVFVISAPIKDDASGDTIGISVAKYKTSKFYSIVENENGLGFSEENFLINKDKYFLTPSRFLGDSVILTQKVETQNSEECFHEDEVAEIKKNSYGNLNDNFNHSPIVEAKDYRGVDIVGTHFYIPETGWCLISKVDSSELYNVNNKLLLIFSLVFIGASLILILIIFYLSGLITKSIIKLKAGAKSVEGGDYSVKIGLQSDDEIGQLASSFDKMVETVKKSQDEIEKRVEDQTREISAKSQLAEDQKKAILNILEDVEKEKNISENLAKDLEKFKMAVDNTSNHIVITDPEGITLYANHAVEEITGFKISEVLGKKAGNKELWGGLMEKSDYEKMWQIIKTDKKTFIGEVNNRRKNGEDYIALANISPVLDDEEKVSFFVGIERDITKEKEVDKAKTEFVSLASHQLRTPLSAINWYTEMLLAGDAGKINKEQKNFLNEIYNGNKRMVDLVNALLNVSRIDLGTFAIEPKPTKLREITDVVVAELLPDIKKKKIKIKNEYDASIPILNIDPNLTKIIFQNLLSNAVKYTPEKGSVSLLTKKQNNDILVTVKDTGYGIPKEAQAKIFTKLYRADNVREKDANGTGLGLYLVKAIVESSGGRIWFESEENRGTTFYVTIPLSGMKEKAGTKGLSMTK